MKSKRFNPLPRTVRAFVAAGQTAPSAVAPIAPAVVCREVAIRADFDRLAADLERELRVALDGEIVALVAGRIRR